MKAPERTEELRATFDYYGQPALKRPHWEWNVVTYLFLGGLMGGSAIVGAIAREPQLRRTAKTTAFILSAVCPPILISHLGRPERFYKMLRVVKLKSPMSLGVWGLIKFSGVAGFSMLLERFGRRSRLLDFSSATLGAFICGYTGVLLSATANPMWGKGKVHIPVMSVASGIAGACALNGALIARGGNGTTALQLERLEIAAGALELAAILHFRNTGGAYAAPMFAGERGQLLRNVTIGAGILAPLFLNLPAIVRNRRKHSISRTLITAALTLAGGYVLRHSLIEGGKDAADDPQLGLHQPK